MLPYGSVYAAAHINSLLTSWKTAANSGYGSVRSKAETADSRAVGRLRSRTDQTVSHYLRRPTPMIDKTLEPAVRAILASLAPAETLSTAALASRLSLNENEWRGIARQLVKLADAVPGLCDRVVETATKGYMKGKRVRRCVWHHIPSPDMPTGTVALAGMSGTSAHVSMRDQRLAGQSFGAASPGRSALAEIQQQYSQLAAEVAQLRADVDDMRSIT